MPLMEIIFLSLLQGLCEFLPISSSAHLLLVRQAFEGSAGSLPLDVALHVGTLGAVVMYYGNLLMAMVRAVPAFLKRDQGPLCRLIGFLVVGTLPVVVAGYFVYHFGLSNFHTLIVLGLSSILFGGLMGVVDARFPQHRTLKDITLLQGLWVGFGQCLALIPGASRLGTCLTVLRLLGYGRHDATTLGFLLSIPAVTGAATLVGFKMFQKGESLTLAMGLGAILSFLVGVLTMRLFLAFMKRGSLKGFALYRVFLGGGLILLWLARTYG